MKPQAGQTIDCGKTPHVDAEHIAFGLHVADGGAPSGVVVMLTPPNGAPLVIYLMSEAEAVYQYKVLGDTIQEFDGETSLVDKVQAVLWMLDKWAVDHACTESVFQGCRDRLRKAVRQAKGGA